MTTEPPELDGRPPGRDDIALLQYTSGSTSTPRASW